MAGLAGYYYAPQAHHPKLDEACGGGVTVLRPSPPDDFESKMEARELRHETLQQAPSGKLASAPSEVRNIPPPTAEALPIGIPLSHAVAVEEVVPEAHGVVTPGRFTRLWVGYPRLVMVGCFLTIGGLSYASCHVIAALTHENPVW